MVFSGGEPPVLVIFVSMGSLEAVSYRGRQGGGDTGAGMQGSIAGYVGVDAKGNLLVGQEARRQAYARPQETAFGFIRFVGHQYSEDEFERLRAHFPYRLVHRQDGGMAIQLADQVYTAEDLAAMLVENLKAKAQDFCDDEIMHGLWIIPDGFGFAQKRALLTLSEKVGFAHTRLLPRSHLPFSGEDRVRECPFVLTQFFGEDDFEVALDGVGIAGDTFCGFKGIAHTLFRQVVATLPPEIAGSPQSLCRLAEALDFVILREDGTASLDLPCLWMDPQGKAFDLHHTFPSPEVQAAAATLRQALERAMGDLFPSRMAGIGNGIPRWVSVKRSPWLALLAKGSATNPKTLFLSEIFSDPAFRIYAYEILTENGRGQQNRLDFKGGLAQSIGLADQGGNFVRIFRRGEVLPASKTRRIDVGRGEKNFLMGIWEGESRSVRANNFLGDLQWRAEGGFANPMDVQFEIGDQNPTVLRAKWLERGVETEVELLKEPYGG